MTKISENNSGGKKDISDAKDTVFVPLMMFLI